MVAEQIRTQQITNMSNIVLLYHPAPLLPEGGDHRPTSSRRGRPPCLPEQVASRDLEPLDKGRLSLGDVGDAFRAKRGKNAGFLSLREKFIKNLIQNLTKCFCSTDLKTTRTARLCRFRSLSEKEHEQHEHSDETNEIEQRRRW